MNQLIKSVFLLLTILSITACGGGGSDKPVPAPTINSFTASEMTITAGASVALTAVFTNGIGNINNAVGMINSNVARSVTPTSTTTYTLTVTNSAGNAVTSTLTITVLTPTITRFTASSAIMLSGSSVNLTAVFTHGTGEIDNAVGTVTSNVAKSVNPASTTTYTLTVSNAEGVAVTSTVTVEVVPIMLSVISPANDQLVADDMTITATIRTELDIAAVRAVVGTRSVDMTYTPDAICGRNGCGAGFTGLLSLNGMAPGSYELTVTAEDIIGRSVSEQRTIILDNIPGFTVAEPIEYSVARPTIPLNVSCSDDVGDCEITVSAGGSIIASGVNTLIDTLDLSAYDGAQITLDIRGKDSANQTTAASRIIYVESSAKLTTVKDFPSLIIDFDGQQALIRETSDTGDRLAILTIASNLIKTVDVPAALNISTTRSFLTPTGVMYTAKAVGGNVLTTKLYDWNNAQLTDLGMPNSASSLTVAGDYAIWSNGTTLWLRQLSTKTNTQVSTTAGNWYNAVGTNGVVSYWAGSPNYSIERYDAGVYTTLAADNDYRNIYVVSDGVRFVYLKEDDQGTAITYHDGTNESLLTGFFINRPSSGRNYQINNGWVAFTELGGIGQTHVWTRDVNGILLQHTNYGSDSYIDGLSADGELMLINSGKRYLSNNTAQSVLIGSTLGKSTKINGQWYITIGRSLFKVL